jgi:glycosyltransferase involved in cell wall biosynthesis
MKVLIVAQHASATGGGEAILPLHYFRLLRRRFVEAWLVAHERSRDELTGLLPEEAGRMYFVPDLPAQKGLFKISRMLPARIADATVGWMIQAATGMMQRSLVRKLVRELGVDVVHEPVPVSPKQPSFMFDVGAPVVIGPMNGGMTFPPAFSKFQGPIEKQVVTAGRVFAQAINIAIPGKRQASTLLVANARTKQALPRVAAKQVVDLVENGVDLGLFRPGASEATGRIRPRFTFLGRLVDWKRVDLLLEALAHASKQCELELQVIGEGPMRPALEAQARALAIDSRVTFHGKVPQIRCPDMLADSDGLVLPSLYECGGAVVLEAMAMGLPVIATNWGGPADYVDSTTGILVEPAGREPFVRGLSNAMVRLARSPDLRRQLGDAGRRKVAEQFDWDKKIDRILEIYQGSIQRWAGDRPSAEQPAPPPVPRDDTPLAGATPG